MRTIPRILIVEDEPAIAELIAVNLRHNGFQPVWAIDAETAQRELDEILPDVILLDWMLPGESGLTLARKWRASARTKAVPILMLTARVTRPTGWLGWMRALTITSSNRFRRVSCWPASVRCCAAACPRLREVSSKWATCNSMPTRTASIWPTNP